MPSEIHNSEGVKKKEANDDVTSLVLTVEQDADGSIHRYGGIRDISRSII